MTPSSSSKLCTYQTSRPLRFSGEKLLKIALRNLKSVSKSSFTSISPSVWNWLPVPVCGIFPPHLSLKVSSRLFCSDRLFRKYRRTTLGCTDYAYIFFYNCIVMSQWNFSQRKFGLPSLGKASCDRIALPNLRCMLGVLVFP